MIRFSAARDTIHMDSRSLTTLELYMRNHTPAQIAANLIGFHRIQHLASWMENLEIGAFRYRPSLATRPLTARQTYTQIDDGTVPSSINSLPEFYRYVLAREEVIHQT
jgi:hypothetical protein